MPPPCRPCHPSRSSGFPARAPPMRFCPPECHLPTHAGPPRPWKGRGVGGEGYHPPNSAPQTHAPKKTHQPAASAAGPPHNGPSALTHPRTPVRGSPERRTPNTDAPLVLVPSPPKRTVLVLVLENRPPALRAFLRGFAASRETHSPQCSKRTDLGLESPSYRKGTTRGLPSAARLNAEHRTLMPRSYSYSVRPGGRYSYSYSYSYSKTDHRPFAPSFAASRLRGFAASRETLSPQCSKRTVLGLESPSYIFGGQGGAIRRVNSPFNEPSARTTGLKTRASTGADTPDAQAAMPHPPQTSLPR